MRHIVYVFILSYIVFSLPIAGLSASISPNVTRGSPEIAWHYTEGYELTEEEVRMMNEIVVARWRMTEGHRLSKRSHWADQACVELNGMFGHHFFSYRSRTADCALPGRSATFTAKCGIWQRDGNIYHSNPWHDEEITRHCPLLAVYDLDFNCVGDTDSLADLPQRARDQRLGRHWR